MREQACANVADKTVNNFEICVDFGIIQKRACPKLADETFELRDLREC